MIKDLVVSSSPHLMVQATPQPYISNINQFNQYSGAVAGQVRFNLAMQQMEVFDGNTWQNITTTASIGLNMSADQAITWAQQQMLKDQELKARLDKHPQLKDAYERFQILDALYSGKEEQVPQ